jgi:hypothetical protein
MDISGQIWTLYPNDAPGPVGFERPGTLVRGPVGIKRIIWRNQSDTAITPGAVVHLKDHADREVFKAVWPEDVGHGSNELSRELGVVVTGLYLTTHEGGVLDLVIE